MKQLFAILTFWLVLSGCGSEVVEAEQVGETEQEAHLAKLNMTSTSGVSMELTGQQTAHLNVFGGSEPGEASVSIFLDCARVNGWNCPEGFLGDLQDFNVQFNVSLLPESGNPSAQLGRVSYYKPNRSPFFFDWSQEQRNATLISLSSISFNDSLFVEDDEDYEYQMMEAAQELKAASFFAFNLAGFAFEGEIHVKSYQQM